jgi:medium-chain acyl-[acyl-carrier-protein] hydrolase
MFERNYIILPSEVGKAGVIKPRNLANCLQDTADMAVTELKADVSSVMKSGYVWILVQVKMSVNRWPKLGETITIRTWHNVNDSLYTFRAYSLRSGNESLMNGHTSWILLDLAHSRPIRPKKNLPQLFILNGGENPEVSSEFTELPRAHSDITGNIHKKCFEVRLHDLDANEHVNNAVYIEWAVESVPKEISKNYQLSGWDVIHRKGAYLGDEVIVNTKEESSCEENSPTIIFTGTMNSGETFLCTVRTYWHYWQKF